MENKVLIIAEAGVNHNGVLENALRLVDFAAEAGADIVKFQTFKADKIVSRYAKKAEYQIRNMEEDNSDYQMEMLRKLEMPEEWHQQLIAYAGSKNIRFASTAFDLESVDLLEKLGQPFFKIPSGEITNKPLLVRIAQKGKPIILSTGMATLEEINEAIAVLTVNGVSKAGITVLHCNTEYPTPMKDVNLKAMLEIRDQLGVTIGYSDHTLGIEIPIAAVALGARVIEKHFTLDRTMEGPDHAASLEPGELKQMVQSIRNVEAAISGSGHKEPSPSEIKNMQIARKSIHLALDVPKGQVLQEEDFLVVRPGNGISPMKIDELIGRKATRDLASGEMLHEGDVE